MAPRLEQPTAWLGETTLLLEYYWIEGMPVLEIAVRMSRVRGMTMTKHAVGGQAHRLNFLPHPNAPPSLQKEDRQKRIPKPLPQRVVRLDTYRRDNNGIVIGPTLPLLPSLRVGLLGYLVPVDDTQPAWGPKNYKFTWVG